MRIEQVDRKPVLIGYGRVSTQQQQQSGHSLEYQQSVLAMQAKLKGCELVYIEDVYTGKDSNRPGLQRALAMLSAGEAQGLVAAKLDRIARSATDFLRLRDIAESEGWYIIMLDLGIDMSTPQGKFAATIFAAIAELEAQMISQRTKDGLAVARSNGRYNRRPLKAPPESVRRSMRNMALSGMSARAIAQKLNSDGIPTVTGRGAWDHTRVRYVLSLTDEDIASGVRLR